MRKTQQKGIFQQPAKVKYLPHYADIWANAGKTGRASIEIKNNTKTIKTDFSP